MVNPTAVVAGLSVAFFFALLLPSLSPHYGFYSDELYYLACARRLAPGYVDHPPLFVFVLRVWEALLGDSLVALRALPALAGALTAFLAGWMTRRMGGGLFAQVLAALAVMVAPNSLAIFSIFTVNATGILLWTVASWVLLELCLGRDRRLWVLLGGVLGIAFMNKHTAVVLIAGVSVAALLCAPLRRDLLGRWPWLGVLLFLVIVSPNVYWQIANDWPSFAFYTTAEDNRDTASAVEQIVGQIVFQNPASFVIWASALYFLLASRAGARLRPLGWLFLTALVLAIIGGSKLPYRIAGVFPVVFAAGAVFIESIRKRDCGRLRKVWNTYTLPALMVLIASAASTIILPIQRPEVLAQNPLYEPQEGSGWRPEIGRNEIPYHLGNRTHWEAFVKAVVDVADGLEPHQREDAILLVDYFGHAGALEYYGRERGLPAVYARMTGYFLWGPPPGEPQTAVSIGIDENFLHANFEHVQIAATFQCMYCPPVVNDLPIYVASGPRRAWEELWKEIGMLKDRRTRMLNYRRHPQPTSREASEGEVAAGRGDEEPTEEPPGRSDSATLPELRRRTRLRGHDGPGEEFGIGSNSTMGAR